MVSYTFDLTVRIIGFILALIFTRYWGRDIARTFISGVIFCSICSSLAHEKESACCSAFVNIMQLAVAFVLLMVFFFICLKRQEKLCILKQWNIYLSLFFILLTDVLLYETARHGIINTRIGLYIPDFSKESFLSLAFFQNVLYSTVAAPFFEELCQRYILNNVICRKNVKERFFSYLILSLSFALLHYNLNSALWIEMIFILARFLMFFFYFVLRNLFPQDDRFFLVVILHGLYNVLAIFFLP